MKYLDPKADLTFKKIFGNHPDRLKNLLNTLQSLNENELKQQQQYLPTTKGIAEGMEKGMKQGMEKGMSQRSLEIARKMLAKGMDDASVMDMTGLTAEEIKLLKAEM